MSSDGHSVESESLESADCFYGKIKAEQGKLQNSQQERGGNR